MTNTSFSHLLETRGSWLFPILSEIKKRAFEEWIHLLVPEHGSHSGYVHLRNVERNADKMIPDEAKLDFSDGEIFLLLASILFHDLGRIVPDKAASKGRTVKTLPDQPCPFLSESRCKDPFRKNCMQGTHACRSRQLIDSLWALFGLPDLHIARYCGLIAFWHQLRRPPNELADVRGTSGKAARQEVGCGPARETRNSFSRTSLEPYGPLRLPLLASIVRIADETENCWTRALRQHWYDAYLGSGKAPHELGKAFRRFIEDVEFSHDGHCIILHVPYSSSEHLDPTNAFVESLNRTWEGTQNVLKAWSRYLSPAGISYEHVFIESDGRLCTQPSANKRIPPPLAKVLEGESGFLESGSTERYLIAILSLVKGTKHYPSFRWSAIEGAIGEPSTPKTRWVIERIGKADRGLTITPHHDRDSVHIAFDLTREEDVRRAVCGGQRNDNV